MRHYEIMVILDPNLEEHHDLVKTQDVLTSFEINKKAEGIYAVIDLQAEPAAVAELDRQLRLNESILRTKVIRPETR